jgi:flagellar hook-length control protein FliK
MNTSFLSAIPAAPAPEPMVTARPAKSGKPVIETEESTENSPVNESEPESTGDTDKAGAFAEMLAAMISVATPTVETHVETVQPAAVESVTSTATDIPRDGAGSPLFAASFMTSTPVAPAAAVTTTLNSTVDSSLPVGKVGGETRQVGNAAGKAEAGIELSDAAVAELSALNAEAVDVTSESVSLTFDVEESTGVTAEATTVETADHNLENDFPVVEAGETTVDSGNVQRDAVDVPEPVVAVDHSVKTQSANTQSQTIDAKAVTAAKSDDVVSTAEAPAEQPVAAVNEPAESEVPKADVQPAATPETAAQDFTPVEEPYENPVAPRAELEDSSSVKSASPRKSSTSPRPVASPAPISAEPEVVNALTAMENSAGVGVRKDDLREWAAAPVEAADKPAPVVMDSEAILSAGTTSEATTALAASNVANTHTDGAAASTPSHVSQQVLQALAAYEAELPQNGSRSFEMLLDPPELGRLLIQMSRTSKGVDVRISAENVNVRSILETAGTELQQNLQLSGFDLGQFSGSNSGSGFANGEEWVAAPTLQSSASAAPSPARSNTIHTTGNSAVNVVV